MILGGPRTRIWNKFAAADFLIISRFQLLFFARKCPDLGYRYCPLKSLSMVQMEIKRTHGSSPDGDFETSESERSDSSCEASPSRRGKYCCVPECKSAFYDINGNPTGISLFKFPLDRRKKRFLTLIKRQENKSPYFFKVTKYTTICEKHFTNDDIIVSIVSKKKKLKRGAEPSIFTIWPKHMQKMPRKERRPPVERSLLNDFTNVESLMEIETAQVIKEDENMQSSLTSVSDLNGSAKSHENICTECPKLQKQLERLKTENKILEDKNKTLTAKIEDKESIISELRQNEFCYENIKNDPDLFKSLIGLSPERFNVLYDL